MQIFWKCFNKLAGFKDSLATADKDTVGRHELTDVLVTTGKFSHTDAIETIDEMLRIKQIEIVMLDTYRKAKDAVTDRTVH